MTAPHWICALASIAVASAAGAVPSYEFTEVHPGSRFGDVEVEGTFRAALNDVGAFYRSADGPWEVVHHFEFGLSQYNDLDLHLRPGIALVSWRVAGGVRRSTDGGTTWATVAGSPNEVVEFVDLPSGAIRSLATGVIHESLDDGLTWTFVSGTPTSFCDDHYWVSDDIGVVLADDVLYRTTDGGASWAVIATIESAGHQDRASSLDGNGADIIATRWASSSAVIESAISVSVDGGATWTPSTIGNRVTVGAALGSGNFLVAGWDVLSSDDLGVTWSTIGSVGTVHGLAVDATGNVWFGQEGDVSTSDDGGASATSALDPALAVGTFRDVDVAGDTMIAAHGTNLYVSGDGGDSWTLQAAPIADVRRVALRDAEVGLLTSTGGDVARTVDGASTWTTETVPVGEIVVGYPPGVDDIVGVAVSTGEVVRSSIAGGGWSTISLDLLGVGHAIDLDWVSEDDGIALMHVIDGGTRNEVWVTSDRGNTWTFGFEVVTSFGARVLSAEWLSGDLGLFGTEGGDIATGPSGEIYRTADGGASVSVANIGLGGDLQSNGLGTTLSHPQWFNSQELFASDDAFDSFQGIVVPIGAYPYEALPPGVSGGVTDFAVSGNRLLAAGRDGALVVGRSDVVSTPGSSAPNDGRALRVDRVIGERFRFELPGHRGVSAIDVFDVSGRHVATVDLIDGIGEWGGATTSGADAANGVYLARSDRSLARVILVR